MANFLLGILSSIVAAAIVAVTVKWGWPSFRNKCLYDGVRIDGTWEISEERNSKEVKVGRLELKQTGRSISGSSVRSKTRDGKKSERKFCYKGVLHGHQLTLLFEDEKGVGFDSGTYVFTVHNDSKTMLGMATFHGKQENKIVSEQRKLTKVLS